MKQIINKAKLSGTVHLIILMVVSILVLIPSLSVKYYGDDFQFLPPIEESPIQLLWKEHSGNNFYRPIQNIILTTIQTTITPDHVFTIHLINLIFHLIIVACIYWFVNRISNDRYAAFLAGFIMGTAQSVALPIGNVDTLSQTMGASFACMSIVAIILANDTNREKPSFIWLLLSYVVWILAILSKETALGYIFALALVYLYLQTDGKISSVFTAHGFLKIIKAMLHYIIIVLLYLLVRSHIVSTQVNFGADNRYGFAIGLNVIKNLAAFGIAIVSPISTVTVFEAVSQRDTLMLLVLGLMSIVTVGSILWYIVGTLENRWLNIFLVLAAILSLMPVVLLNQVSELYAYNALPIYSILIGLSFRYAFLHLSSVLQAAFVGFIIIFFGLNLIGLQQKLTYMRANGEQTKALLDEITNMIKTSEEQSRICIVIPFGEQPESEYSVFVMNNELLLFFANNYIAWIVDRNPETISYNFSKDATDIITIASCNEN